MTATAQEKAIRIDGRILRIARLDGDKYTFPDDPEETIAAVRRLDARADLFTFLQRPDEPEPKYTYPMEWDNLAVLPVSTFENWFKNQVKSTVRNRSRQAEKRGAVVREVPFDDGLLRGIVAIHNECPIRQGRRFPHYGMDVEGARRYAGTFLDRTIFIGASVGDDLIGFAKLTVDETGIHACIVNILSMVKHREKAPTNALIAQAVRSCASRGIRYLVYENFSYGKKAGDSLSHFKETNGFRQVNLPRYYVPLTAFGGLAYRLGLHRRVAEYCPEFVMSRLRSLRTAWLTLRLGNPSETVLSE